MPMISFPPLSDVQKGLVYFIGGLLIVLYAFGFFSELLNVIVICGGFAMMIHGFVRAGGVAFMQKMRSKVTKK